MLNESFSPHQVPILTLSLVKAQILVVPPIDYSNTVEYLVWPSSPHPVISTTLDGLPQLTHPTQNGVIQSHKLLQKLLLMWILRNKF